MDRQSARASPTYYYTLAPHIALEHSGLAYEAVRIERGMQSDPSYLAINPLARVPALQTSEHGTITEVPAVLSLIADLAPDRGLLPGVGAPARYEALRWMAFFSSTLRVWAALAGRAHYCRRKLRSISGGRWGLRLASSTRQFPNFYCHTLAVANLVATKSAISQEGITFEGPRSG